MGLLRYIKSLFLRKDVRGHLPPTPIQTKPVTKELDHVVGAKIPSTAQAKSITVTIGLDFGTSTTKCVVNLEGEDNGRDRFLAISFPQEGSEEGTLCVPTAIGVDNHTLLFGFDAEHLSEDKIIRSFKMAIPCMIEEWGGYKSSFMIIDKPGYFDICGHKVSAIDLSTLYIAGIIRQIKKQLSVHAGGGVGIQEAYLNMAAPLDQLKKYYEAAAKATNQEKSEILLGNIYRDTKLSEYYMQLGQWSLRLSNVSHDRWNVEEALTSLDEVKKGGVVSFEDSPAYVLPETLAAISAYVNRPRTRQGRFISFDVGAGTTDVSVFWLQKQHGSPKPSYYASGSLHIGMDDVDLSLLDILPQPIDCSLRERRESLEENEGNLIKYEDRWKPIFDKIEKHKNQVFGLAYNKERIPVHWGNGNHAEVTLLMLGGGCKSSIIEKISQLSLWDNFIGTPLAEILGLNFTETVILPNGTEAILSKIPLLLNQADLLVVAEGLAQRIINIPPYDFTTEPILPRPRLPRDDYLNGHWW